MARGPPQVDDFQVLTEWFCTRLSDTLGLLLLPSTGNTSPQEERPNAEEQLISGLTSAIDMRGMLSSLAPQWNQSSHTRPVVRDHSHQQTSRNQVDLPSSSDAICSPTAAGQAPTSTSNATSAYPSPESQHAEAIAPTPTTAPYAQSYLDPDPYSQATHLESQESEQGQCQNQPPLEDLQPLCDRCFGGGSNYNLSSSTTEWCYERCPFCNMHTPASDYGDIYNA
jgi:hypothetical protein